ncbi:hypothetical protein FQN57_002368 [Myotisia sp. PD_48]|nr:hypothetical protein FQN57_002368 [Myotisia sp. PD_48]
MTSYFSSIKSSSAISNLSTRFTSLRRAITSDEIDDPENEDLSHISNVLRTYYTEKGRRLPPWLPPDKKTAANAPAAIATQSSFQGYGGNAHTSPPPAAPAGRGGLGDLWGDSRSTTSLPQQTTASLRAGRGANNGSSHFRPSPTSLPSRPATTTPGGRETGGYSNSSSSSSPSGARPLPSQRAGSHQNTPQQLRPGGVDRSHSGASAQDRLRARFQGGGATKPWASSASLPGGYSKS